MIINGAVLLRAMPIKDMSICKMKLKGVSHGLGEAGYDIRIAETVHFLPRGKDRMVPYLDDSIEGDSNKIGFYRQAGPVACIVEPGKDVIPHNGNFILASAMEQFQMPENLVGVVHDKSTWARKGLSVFNTVIEPGWEGYLTLELVYHGYESLTIPAGSGIAQVIFHEIKEPAQYKGKYQNQQQGPVAAIFEGK